MSFFSNFSSSFLINSICFSNLEQRSSDFNGASASIFSHGLKLGGLSLVLGISNSPAAARNARAIPSNPVPSTLAAGMVNTPLSPSPFKSAVAAILLRYPRTIAAARPLLSTMPNLRPRLITLLPSVLIFFDLRSSSFIIRSRSRSRFLRRFSNSFCSFLASASAEEAFCLDSFAPLESDFDFFDATLAFFAFSSFAFSSFSFLSASFLASTCCFLRAAALFFAFFLPAVL
mmetsp:Transcript_29488/g.33890  ORF Transcript_29488/g.33890 Transcript_29488/m.33890 type:complete len:231 (+) Transcript_29488:1230-1922(+)